MRKILSFAFALMFAASPFLSAAPALALDPVLTTIAVSPADATIVAGETQQFTASALDQDENPLAEQPVFTWTSSDEAIGTIDSSGLFTAVAAGGPVTITAASGDITGTSTITVDAINPVLTSIAVSPATSTLEIGATQQFTASALDQDGDPLTIQPTFVWTSSDEAIGTIDSNGLFTAVAAGGPVTITASSDAITGTALIDEVTSVPIPPPVPVFEKGFVFGRIGYSSNNVQKITRFMISANPKDGNLSGRGYYQSIDKNGGRYLVHARYTAISGNDAFFAGPVVWASDSSLKGQWLYAKVHDSGQRNGEGDEISGSFMDEAAAAAHFTGDNLTDPAEALAVEKGNLSVRTFSFPKNDYQVGCGQ